MKIEPHVYFEIEYAEIDNKHGKQTVLNINEFKHYIQCYRPLRVVSCAFLIKRQVYFVANNRGSLGPGLTTDELKIIVAQKLTYLSDLQEYLKRNAENNNCQDVIFKNFSEFTPEEPIFFTGPYEFNGSFLPDAPIKSRPLTCRPLNSQDIVVDKNLNQIWPVKTGKPPVGLVELLSKTTEKIY